MYIYINCLRIKSRIKLSWHFCDKTLIKENNIRNLDLIFIVDTRLGRYLCYLGRMVYEFKIIYNCTNVNISTSYKMRLRRQ